jgi:hypothetical protein
MPNGGSDCCGTCWFNAKNKGEAGYEHSRDPEIPFCVVRELAIEDPFYTYCANHPHRRSERDPIPIGPALTGDSDGRRSLWRSSPDSAKIRMHLLALLQSIKERPASEYPIGAYLDEVVVWQLGEFRETRAVPDLRRLVGFDPLAAEVGPFGRTRSSLVALAEQALGKIEGHLVGSDAPWPPLPAEGSAMSPERPRLRRLVLRRRDPRRGHDPICE